MSIALRQINAGDLYELLGTIETRDRLASGETLDNLDEVIAAVEDDAGRPPTDDEFHRIGIDPENNRRARSSDLSDALK